MTQLRADDWRQQFRHHRVQRIPRPPKEPASLFLCPIINGEVGSDGCAALSKDPDRNRDGCVANKCQSPWRVRPSRVLLEAENPRRSSDVNSGFCATRGGANGRAKVEEFISEQPAPKAPEVTGASPPSALPVPEIPAPAPQVATNGSTATPVLRVKNECKHGMRKDWCSICNPKTSGSVLPPQEPDVSSEPVVPLTTPPLPATDRGTEVDSTEAFPRHEEKEEQVGRPISGPKKRAILKRLKNGENPAEIAETLGVNLSSVEALAAKVASPARAAEPPEEERNPPPKRRQPRQASAKTEKFVGNHAEKFLAAVKQVEDGLRRIEQIRDAARAEAEAADQQHRQLVARIGQLVRPK